MKTSEIEAVVQERHRALRKTCSIPADTLLVTNRDSLPVDRHQFGVGVMSRTDEQETTQNIAATKPKVKAGSRNSTAVLRVFKAQQPSQILDFNVSNRQQGTANTPCSQYLPCGGAVVDNLAVHLMANSDWRRYLPAVHDVQRHRSPLIGNLPSPWEIVAGETDDLIIRRTIARLETAREQVTRKFGFCWFGLDVECVPALPRGEDLRQSRAGVTYLRLAKRGESASSFPVRLMVGHMGFHIQISFPFKPGKCDQLGDVLAMEKLETQPSLAKLLESIGHVVGVGVREDWILFVVALARLFDIPGEIVGSLTTIELGALARYAGYNLQRYSLSQLNWYVLGGMLAKGEGSCADGQWARRWDAIDEAFQIYAYGDVAQAAAIGWVLAMCLTIHRFPDVSLIKQVSYHDHSSLLLWWTGEILPRVQDPLIDSHGAASLNELVSHHQGSEPVDILFREHCPRGQVLRPAGRVSHIRCATSSSTPSPLSDGWMSRCGESLGLRRLTSSSSVEQLRSLSSLTRQLR